MLSLAGGSLGAPLAEYDAYAGWIYAPKTQRIIGGVTKGMEPAYVFFDPKEQASWDRVVSQLSPTSRLILSTGPKTAARAWCG